MICGGSRLGYGFADRLLRIDCSDGGEMARGGYDYDDSHDGHGTQYRTSIMEV